MPNTSHLSFPDIAQWLSPLVDAALDAHTAQSEGCPVRLHEAVRYSLLAPGKRFRPILTLLAAEACGSAIEDAMPAACAVEMVHTYSLIHDDLPAMDNDDLRRGRPTCHKAFDEATAILAGDALLTRAFEVLAKEIQPPTVAAACCAALAEAAGGCHMVGGQADDIAIQGNWSAEAGTQAVSRPFTQGVHEGGDIQAQPTAAKESSLALLESIHHRKTGAMIRVALKLGALVAQAPPPQVAALDAYGRRVGLTFQITDDLLDVTSNAATLGKRVGKDAEQGKLTFPGLLGFEQSVQYAKLLTAEACRSLELFGDHGEKLRVLAYYVQGRNR